MSIDIAFDLYEAQEAGAEVQVFVAKYDESYGSGESDMNYYMSYGFRVGQMEGFVQADIFEPEDSKESIKISVRSRRQHSYITSWLQAHSIAYGEY